MPAEWFARGREDLLAARTLLSQGVAPNAAGALLQQAVEKGLKGFLLASGKPVRRIHDLEELLDEAIEARPGLERFRDLCTRATAFHALLRYPSLPHEPLDEDQLEALVAAATTLLDELEA